MIRARNARRLSAAKKRCEPHCRYRWFGRLRGLGVGGRLGTDVDVLEDALGAWTANLTSSRSGTRFHLATVRFHLICCLCQICSAIGSCGTVNQWPLGNVYLLHALIRHAMFAFSAIFHRLYASTLAMVFLLSRYPHVMSQGMPMYGVCSRPASTLTSKTCWQLLCKVSGKPFQELLYIGKSTFPLGLHLVFFYSAHTIQEKAD